MQNQRYCQMTKRPPDHAHSWNEPFAHITAMYTSDITSCCSQVLAIADIHVVLYILFVSKQQNTRELACENGVHGVKIH